VSTVVNMRRVRGVCAFEVEKDANLAFMDMKNSGLRLSKYLNSSLYRKHHVIESILDEAQSLLPPFIKTCVYVSGICYYKSRKLYVRFYYDATNTGILRAVLLVSLNRGTLRVLSRRLENLGWRRILYFEIIKYISYQHSRRPPA